jgi:hypothetical protein
MESAQKDQLTPGTRVKITQQIAARDYTWTTETIGTVRSYQQKPTGSWFAHAKGDKLWLDRLTLKKDNGEITTLNLDEYTVIQLESPLTPASPATPEKKDDSDLPV